MGRKVTVTYTIPSPRGIGGRVLNVIGAMAFVSGGVTGIVGSAFTIDRHNIKDVTAILYTICFSLWCVGSVLYFLQDIITIPIRRNLRSIAPILISGFIMIPATILLIIGSALYIDSSPSVTRDAAFTLWIIGSSLFLLSTFIRFIAIQATNMAIIRKNSCFLTKLRAWASIFSVLLMLLCGVLLCIGSVITPFPGKTATVFGVGLWLAAFASFGFGSIFYTVALSPLQRPENGTGVTKVAATPSAPQNEHTSNVVVQPFIRQNVKDIVEHLECQRDSEVKLMQLRGILGGNGRILYNYLEVVILLNSLPESGHKLELLRTLVESKQIDMNEKYLPQIVAAIGTQNIKETTQILFAQPALISTECAINILCQCDADQSRFDVMQVIAPSMHITEEELEQTVIKSLYQGRAYRDLVEDTIRKLAPSCVQSA